MPPLPHNPLSALMDAVLPHLRVPARTEPVKTLCLSCQLPTVWGDFCLACQDMQAFEPVSVSVVYRDAMLFAEHCPFTRRILTNVYLAGVKEECVDVSGEPWLAARRMPFAKFAEMVRRVYLKEAK